MPDHGETARNIFGFDLDTKDGIYEFRCTDPTFGEELRGQIMKYL